MRSDLKNRLVFHWKRGFLRKLKYSEFDVELANDFRSTLKAVPKLSEDDFDKEYMYILWLIPLYTEWQYQRMIAENVDFDRQIFSDIRQIFFDKFDNPSGPSHRAQ
jgi:hypothetical protein